MGAVRMKKFIVLLATAVGAWFFWSYGEQLELWELLSITYVATVITMYLLRKMGVAFNWISSSPKVLLWAVPVGIVYLLWVLLVSSIVLVGICLYCMYLVLISPPSEAPQQNNAGNRYNLDEEIAYQNYVADHNRRLDEEIRRAEAQGHYRKAGSFEREKL